MEERKHTSSRSILDSISNICLDCLLRSLPQINLVHTNTMKVALIPNPMTVVIRFIPDPNILTSAFLVFKKKHQISNTQISAQFSRFKQMQKTTNTNTETLSAPYYTEKRKWQMVAQRKNLWGNHYEVLENQ